MLHTCSLEYVIDLFQRDKRLGSTILPADDATLMDILLNALITPPREVFALWDGTPIVGGTARDEVVDAEESFLCHKWKDEECEDGKENSLFHCFSSF